MAQVDVIITPLTGNIVFYDNDLAAQNSVRIQGESQGVLYFAGDGVNIPSSGLTAPTASTNPNQSALPYPGQAANASASNSLFVILDSITGTITPGLSGYEMGSSTLPWRYWGTAANFSGAVTLAATSSLFLANTGGSNGAPLTFSVSASAPTSLSAGQMWWDGTNLNFYTSTTKIFGWADFSNVSGFLSVSHGGTGVGTFTSNGVLYGNTTSAIQVTAASGAIGAILQTTSSGGVPSFANTLPGTYTFSGSGTALTVTNNALISGNTTSPTYYGSSSSGGTLTLSSTSNATKGKILIGSNAAFDEVNTRLGVGTQGPVQRLDVGYGHFRFTTLSHPSAPTVATGSAGSLTGNYYYFVTFVTTQGETNAGIVSSVVTPSSQQVSLTAIPTDATGNATSRNIYRTTTGGASGGPFYLLTTIGDNTTTSYTDNTVDGSLGTINYFSRENTTAGYFYVGTQFSGYSGFSNTIFGQSNQNINNISGTSNVGFGPFTYTSLTTGTRNSAVGYNALNALTTGSYNTGVGCFTLVSVTTGQNNVGMGHKTLQGSIVGSNNTAIGSSCCDYNVNGSSIVSIGYNSLNQNSFSSNITALGTSTDFVCPATFTATATSGAGLNTGVYQYMVTFVVNSNETNPNCIVNAPVSVTTTGSNSQVSITGIPTYTGPYTATRKLYRTKVGGSSTSTFYLLTTIGDNITTSYTDSTADTSLVTTYNPVNSGILIGAGATGLYANQLVIGSTTSSVADAYIGNGIYTSSPQSVTLHATGASASNTAGANFTIAPGQSTGTAAGGFFSVQTAAAGSSGSTFNALTERFRIDSTGLTSVKGSFNAGSSAQMTIDTSGNIGTSGGYTQTGTTANTFSGATTFSAASTALTVNNNATISGLLGVGAASSAGNQLNVVTTAIGNVGIYVNAITGQTANLQNWAVNGTLVANINASGNFTATTTITINNIASGNPISFTASAGVSATQAYILPTNVPSGTGQFLTCTSTAPYQFAWAVPAASASSVSIGSTVTGGTDTYMLYITNIGTPTLSQDPGLTYNYGNQALQLAGTVSNAANLIVTKAGITTTSTAVAQIVNSTLSTGGSTLQQSPALDYIGHAWNTTATAADNFVRMRSELQVTSAATPTGTFIWKSSVDTGTASYTNRMTLTTGGLLTVSNGLTITAGTFTIGSFTFALSSNSTLSLNSQTLTMNTTIGNFTIGAGTGTSATQHNFVQSGTTQYVLESATAPTALGDMYYGSTTSYATMTKLSIGVRGATLVASTSTPTPTWLAPSSTAGVAIISGGTGADLAYGTIVVAGGGTGNNTFGSTNSLLVTGSSSTGAFATVTGASGLLYGTAANTAPTFTTSIGALITFTAGLTVTTVALTTTLNALTTTSTLGFALQNTTASTAGAVAQQSPGFDLIGHVWNTTVTAADNTARFRQELQVTSGTAPFGTLVWKSSVDTGAASFTNRMTLTSAGLLTVSNGLTITAGTFTIGSFTFAVSSSSTLSTNSQTLTMNASIGNFTIGAGTGTSATQHNFVQSGTTQYVLESATAPTALGDMYYASTTSYATMTKLSIGVRGATLVASTATPTPTWLAPSATAGVAIISGGTGADLAYGTVVVAGGGTGQASFASTNSLVLTGSSSTGAFATVTGASGLLYNTAANTAPTFTTSIGATITFSNGATISGGTFTLNTLESCTLTITGTAPNAGRSDVDTWQPSGAPTTDYYAYYQQVKYDSNQANTFGIAGLRSDAITTATMTSSTLARTDSMLAFYSPGHGGTVSQATGLRVTQLATWLGTTTNYMGVRIESNYTSGTLTNAAGLYIDVIGSKGSSSGASVYLVSDGTAKTGLSWGTSTSAYTADVGLFRSGAGTLTITGTATVTNGLTINNAKTTVAASTTGYASLNIPAGTAPTSPSNGDTYYDSSGILWFYDGTTAKRINKHQASICMCAGYTPTGTGTGDVCEFVVPYKGDGTTQITYNVRRIDFRVGTAGTGGSVTVEVYTGTSAFPAYGTATVIGTTTLTTGTYENSTTSSFTTSTVQSGNKVRFTPVTIAGTANWTVMLELEEA